MELPRNCESKNSSKSYKGQRLVPEPAYLVQDKGTCIFFAIVARAIMQLRNTMFDFGRICEVFFNARDFVEAFVLKYGPLDVDPDPRAKRALTLFKDDGIQAYDLSGDPPYFPQNVKIKSFTSYAPVPNDSKPGEVLVYSFVFIASLLKKGNPVLGSFLILVDEDGNSPPEFELLGDGIYDCLAMERRYPSWKSITHAVAFVDFGRCEGRPFLKFLNTNGVWWGKDGFGKVYFDGILQLDENFCFHTISFKDTPACSSLPTASRATANLSKLPPPCTAHLPCHWYRAGSTVLNKIVQGSVDVELFLEAALGLYCGKINKPDAGRLKALLLLAHSIEADPSTVSHSSCVAASEGLQSSDMLVKYMKENPRFSNTLLISAGLHQKYGQCPSPRGFDELLMDWPKEVRVQFLCNQYAEHALADNIELAEKVLTRWLEEYEKQGDNDSSNEVSEEPSLTSTLEVCSGSSASEDQVCWLLNFSLYTMLESNLQEAQVAVDKALKLAQGESHEHYISEHAPVHTLERLSSYTDSQTRGMLSLISGYIADHQNIPMPQRFVQNVKKHKLRLLIDDILSPASADSYLLNSVLEVCYGLCLLPDQIEVMCLIDFIESVVEILPANYHLALTVGTFMVKHYTGADPTSTGTMCWASSVLLNAILCDVPVAPVSSVWLEGANLMRKLQASEIVKRFQQGGNISLSFLLQTMARLLDSPQVQWKQHGDHCPSCDLRGNEVLS